MLTGTSPVWSILHQLYGYTALLEEAVQQLCKVQLTQHAQTSFCSFCTTTILASNHKGSFCGSNDLCVFSPMQQESLHSIIAAIDKQGVSTCVLYIASRVVGTIWIYSMFSGQDVHLTLLSSLYCTAGTLHTLDFHNNDH